MLLSVDLDPKACYQAGLARDRRFDGKFFTAVLTTGIYCRPICPARTPHFKNVAYYACAAAAEANGFRPCKRCRPDTAPGSPAWAGTSSTVLRALRMIAHGTLDAEKLGVSDRHLRRLFQEELGASPLAISHVERLHFARKLIEETTLPLSAIAFNAGFQSIRRFNDALKSALGKTPSELRKTLQPQSSGNWLHLKLPYAEPYDWPALLRFLSARAIAGVETVTPELYRRTFRFDGNPGILEVRHLPAKHSVELRITSVAPASLQKLARKVRRLFDLDAEPRRIHDHFAADPVLAPLIARRPGLRVPGAFDTFELVMRAVLGQQVTVRGASTLAARIVEKWGSPHGAERLFPLPETLATADMSTIGLPGKRAATLQGVARTFAGTPAFLEDCTSLEEAVQRMVNLDGIGPWTAHYVAMRALNEPDAFPSSDLALLKAVGLKNPKDLINMAEAWRPWRAYAALHLWMKDYPL